VKEYTRFIDQWGLLDKVYLRDGGDTCQREGMFWSLLGMMTKERRDKWLKRFEREFWDYAVMIKKLHVHDGIFIRHVRPDNDVNAWDRMSRDQLQCQVIAAGYWSESELRRIIKGHKSRFFLRTTNIRNNGATKENHGQIKNKAGELFDYSPQPADFTGPEIWGNMIRGGRKKWYKKFLLWFLDPIELFGGSVKWKYWPRNNIALNQCVSVLQGLDRIPTFWSVWAEKIMPIAEYNAYILDHLDDFHDKDTMIFLTEMVTDAHEAILERRKRA